MPAEKHLWWIMQKALFMSSAFCMIKGTSKSWEHQFVTYHSCR